ncbi:non-ribosomal peptide synthetase/type I polyketide synthase [Dyella silvatica]|uniref:non-ribosomal peptide synthetase/type I polyketide synthase n=1 Tax=Dyella silvatica TaxID=2992128 RepID=UPI00225313DD|nr:non-ribosomal peptide synthetase/type I polyketide synthase [Dyella silvatica]
MNALTDMPSDDRDVFLFRASSAQQRLWLLDRLSEGRSGEYLIAGALRLQGALNAAALQAALNDCIALHESLRTSFAEVDGTPWQAVEPALTVALQQTDLRQLPPEQRWPEAMVQHAATEPFELSHAPLLRALLLQLDGNDWLFALTIHHLVCDGPSLAQLINDIAAAYAHRIDPGQAAPAMPGVQLADYAEWQCRQLDTPSMQSRLAYWQQRLHDVPDLQLPLDYPRPAIRRAQGARVAFELPRSVRDALMQTARRYVTTPFALLLGAWGVTLARWSGQHDFAIGTPVSGHHDVHMPGAVGFFAETAAWRFDISDDTDAETLWQRTRESWAEALSHSGVPLDRLLNRLDRGLIRDRTPLFQTLFSLAPALPLPALPGLHAELVSLPIGQAKTDVSLELNEHGDAYAGVLEYDRALFSLPRIERLAAYFQDVLTRLLSEPQRRLRDLPRPPTEAPTHPLTVSAAAIATPAAAGDITQHPLYLSVREVWRELLGDVAIDERSHFFEIGGHSLLAAKAVARLRKKLQRDLPMAALFDAPVLGDLLAVLDNTAQRHADEVPVTATAAARTDLHPLSPAQARLWFIQQLEPDSSAYHLSGAVQIDGDLHVDALTQAVQLLRQRHDILRTRFIDEGGRPLQHIMPLQPLLLAPESLESLSEPEQDIALKRIVAQLAKQPFELSAAAPLRMQLLRLGPQRHVFCLVLHHMLADGWSIDLLWRELGESYRLLRQGQPPALPTLPLQYADYARWQLGMLDGATAQRQIEAWRSELADLPTLELTTDWPRPAFPGSAGAQLSFSLSSTAIAALDGLARATGGTRFSASLTAFAVLLARWSGQHDFAIGVPVSGRDHDNVHELIGCFVNVLPIRAELADARSYAALATQLQQRCRSAFERQSLPFERLLQALRPAPDSSRHPLFQVLFNYLNTEIRATSADGLHMQPLALDSDAAQFELAVYLEDAGDTIRCNLVYRTELFHTATIERMAHAFRSLLEAAASDADWADVDMVDAADHRQLDAWNATAIDYGPASTLDALIAAQVQRTPQACAIRAEDGELSFAHMLEQADRLAGSLRALGAGPGRVVAVLLPRGVDLPVALLAVLRAGAAYLPLDIELPPERLSFMLEDAAPLALIADPGSHDWLTSDLPVLAPRGHRHRAAPAAGSTHAPDDIAYVIYTSGSTGKPKGVMVPHAGIVNRLHWMQAEYGLATHDRVLQKTPCGFDVSVWEFFWPMLSGASLVMARPGGHRDPDYLAQTIEREGITTVHFVPSMLDIFLSTAEAQRCAPLRRIFTSGEALSPQLRDRCLDFAPQSQLHNLYGPTEASVDVTYWPCLPQQRGGPVPIGMPVANTRSHVLDQRGRETPIGVPGEICIAGVQVARGYLNRPELNAERFVRDPFVAHNASMYRTGDHGRWHRQGWIEYLGRRDNQVKLRGQRSELGEIEAALRQHPAVRDAIVLLLGEGVYAHLDAYALVTADAPDGNTLRAFLGQHLPAAMVPTRVLPLAEFPLTSSGKTDRRALAALSPASAGEPAAASRHTPPEHASQRQIAEIWSEVLGVAQVDSQRSFFEAGGNSLLLVQVHARLKHCFDPPPSLMDLFRFPTVAALAAHLDGAGAPSVNHTVRVQPVNEPIAIIGMAGRFPGAGSVEALWQALLEARSGIREVTRDEALADGADDALLAHPAYVPYAAPLNDIEAFDEKLFGYSPADAALLDPQGRLLLQCAWETLEQAALNPAHRDADKPEPRIGVFAGATLSTYALHTLREQARVPGQDQRVLFANDKDYIASRIAYKLGLNGPAIGVQTACSSSLVAVALAVHALRHGECDVALAGGASVSVPHRVGYLYEEGSILSPDGRCRAFDTDAGGTVGGNGVAMVALKRLSQALADGDPVRAVIRGIATNNDGADKIGFTAPSVGGQEAVLRAALADAGLNPADIGYIEAHGTGTRLGDEVELTALAAAFGNHGQPCLLGSLKSSIGHLDAAAGVAGLIKAALAVERGMVPATLHVQTPNPLLQSEATRFRLATATTAWSDQQQPRRAGVSAFGIGGTNAHCIVEQPPARRSIAMAQPQAQPQVLLLSAADPAALRRQRERLADCLQASYLHVQADAELAALAWTLQSGRRALPWRQAFSVKHIAQALPLLRESALPTAAAAQPRVYLLFPGQGSQSAAMGAELYAEDARFRASVDACLALLPPTLREAVIRSSFTRAVDDEAKAWLQRTDIAQPALFIVEYALAQWLLACGVQPVGLLGHSLGELVAATIAGVFSLEAALPLVIARGRLMHEAAPGAMLQVSLPAHELAAILPAQLCIAAINTPQRTVVAGAQAAIDAFAAELQARDIEAQSLRVAHAFHSPLMSSAAQALREPLAAITPQTPTLPLLSNLSGDWMDSQEALDRWRWVRQIEQPVRFAEGLQQLAGTDTVLIEVGPGRTLSAFAREAGLNCTAMLPSHSGDAAQQALLHTLGVLWQAGCQVNWQRLHGEQRPVRLALPSYPFAANRHWLGASTATAAHLAMLDWQRAPLPALPGVVQSVALFGDDDTLADALAERFAALGVSAQRITALDDCQREQRLVVLSPDFPQLLEMARRLAGHPPERLIIVSRHAQDDGAATDADAAMTAAAALVLAQEQPELGLRQIDLAGAEDARQLAALAAECLADGPAIVLLRDAGRRLPQVHALATRPRLDAARATVWRDAAVVLITGGFGQLGMHFAQHLARHAQARLVLLGRHAPAADDPRLQMLRQLGAEVLVLSGDIAAAGVAQSAVRAAIEHFGALHSVIHAAGIAGAAAQRPLLDTGLHESESIWAAKREGVRQLADALHGVSLDHVLLCSSISSVLGGLGFAAYAAGNRWLEVFADAQSRRGTTPWLALAYDGLHLDDSPPQGLALDAQASIELAEQALSAGLSGRVLALAGDLHSRLQRWSHAPGNPALPQTATQLAELQATIHADYPGDPLQAQVAQSLAATLGLARIGPDDDFFALGGDSLVATRLIAQLRAATGLPLSVGLVLQAPTVRLLAATLAAMLGHVGAEDESDEAFEEGVL